jgi:ADP-heptose:LPS heptosyltransferase
METLIIKLNATGDVVRTTPLLRRLRGQVTWITDQRNRELLDGLSSNILCLDWDSRSQAQHSRYDVLINLEDDAASGAFAATVPHDRLFGAYLTAEGRVAYTDDARRWFDMSLISVYGRDTADRLKFINRSTYQELIFEGLGFRFEGERYLLPKPVKTDLCGDVAIAPVAGPVWPNKNWEYYSTLKEDLERAGLRVNVLPQRASLLEHIGDVANHRCLVCGDSLPMHLALGLGISCVTLFNCTSPWEIHDYGLQTKILSPLLGEFFYHRGEDARATSAISLHSVHAAVMNRLATSVAVR